MDVPVYTQKGEKKGTAAVPETIFNVRWNGDLMHDAVTILSANRRTNTAHAKDRSDVSGGGRKPWRQKGTGNARHGSIRSPLWRGGGATFGPRSERTYQKQMNKKVRAKALFTALSQKLRDSELLFVDTISFSAPKTADARSMLMALAKASGSEALAKRKNNYAYIVLPEVSEAVRKSFRNFEGVKIEEIRNMNALDVLTYRNVIVVSPEQAVDILTAKVAKETTGTAHA